MRRLVLSVVATLPACTHEYFFGEADAVAGETDSADATDGPTTAGASTTADSAGASGSGGSDSGAGSDGSTTEPSNDTDDDPPAGIIKAAYWDVDGDDVELRIVHEVAGSHCTVMVIDDTGDDEVTLPDLDLPSGWSVSRFGILPLDADCDPAMDFDELFGEYDYDVTGWIDFSDDTEDSAAPCEVSLDLDYEGIDPPGGVPDDDRVRSDDLTPDNCE